MATNGALYGIIGALGVAVAGGGLYIAKEKGAFETATVAPVTAPAVAPVPAPAPPPPKAAAPQAAPTPPPAPSKGPSQAEGVLVRQLVLDARRAITRGDFAAADRALDQAERINPQSDEVIAARRDMREAQQRAQREDRRVDAMVADARAAIARRDFTDADRLLDQAERMDARDRGVQQARAELNAAQQQPQQTGRDNNRRVDGLVAQARTAISRHDYTTADRLLDQAENIDARDRDVQQARAELNAASRPAPGPAPGPGRR
jgi:tetratricopeptide (TPR) repeat protein